MKKQYLSLIGIIGLSALSLGGLSSKPSRAMAPNNFPENNFFHPDVHMERTYQPQLAQQVQPLDPQELAKNTIIFAQTSRVAVRIFDLDDQLRINLHNKVTGITELSRAPVTKTVTASETSYRYAGEFTVQVTVQQSGAIALQINDMTREDFDTVTGTVTYRPRIALPDNTIIEVALVDVSRTDVAGIVLASQKIVTSGRQVPIPFELMYDPKQINSAFSYVVQARITVDDKLRFVSTSSFPVITRDNPSNISVLVDPVGENAQKPENRPPAAEANSRLEGTAWQLEQIQYNNDTLLKPPSPQNYTLEFLADGKISARVDCNRALGNYTVTDSSLSIQLGPTTLAACPPDSLEQEYRQALEAAAIYFFRGDDLYIDLKLDTGTMQFSKLKQ